MKNEAEFFWVWLATSPVARKLVFLHHLGRKQSYLALFVFRPRTEFMSFFPYFNYNSAVFLQNTLTRQIALIQYSGRPKHARFPSTTNYKITSLNFFI